MFHYLFMDNSEDHPKRKLGQGKYAEKFNYKINTFYGAWLILISGRMLNMNLRAINNYNYTPYGSHHNIRDIVVIKINDMTKFNITAYD